MIIFDMIVCWTSTLCGVRVFPSQSLFSLYFVVMTTNRCVELFSSWALGWPLAHLRAGQHLPEKVKYKPTSTVTGHSSYTFPLPQCHYTIPEWLNPIILLQSDNVPCTSLTVYVSFAPLLLRSSPHALLLCSGWLGAVVWAVDRKSVV